MVFATQRRNNIFAFCFMVLFPFRINYPNSNISVPLFLSVIYYRNVKSYFASGFNSFFVRPNF
ncbi:hypothetical protein DRQ50_14530 [bacterium]|nr:MAG: hypothetical protein DRQ50_14530 [bacterium]